MTTPYERLRALQWAGELLRTLVYARSKHPELLGGRVPAELRRQALVILRHYPDDYELLTAAKRENPPWPNWIGLDPFEPKKSTGTGSGSSDPEGES
ncbi:MAG: BPSL0761 family protein [Burkholderiales bacterium]